jgi:hypothetical protein
MADCAVLDYPPGSVTGPGAVTGERCDWPADFIVGTSCPHGHASREPMCEDHARLVAGEEGFCPPCAAAGHRCPLTAESRECLP